MDWNDLIQKSIQEANRNYPSGCPACKGIRFKPCISCGQPANSYRDFRDYPKDSPRRSDFERDEKLNRGREHDA